MTENEAMLLGKLSAATARTASVEAKLADCERRERAAVERAEALRDRRASRRVVERPPFMPPDDEARAT